MSGCQMEDSMVGRAMVGEWAHYHFDGLFKARCAV